MKRLFRAGAMLAVVCLLIPSVLFGAEDEIPFEGTRVAPEFPPNLEWLNTDKPLTLAGLKGKIVLLDFWTYCCINCMHVIPDLKKLEAKYGRELVVIGVHSAKFTNEKQTDNIRQAIKRYEIEHPVVNDKDMLVWRLYGTRAWPTLVLINPNGRVIGNHSGEEIFELFDSVIAQAITRFDGKKEIDRKPIEFKLERWKGPQSLFAYPGKITADEKTARIFFSDSNNNRLIVATADGQILDAIGGPEPGLQDGNYTTARFFRPQGLCYEPKEEALYVADTENHSLRKVDLTAKKVSTLGGIGRQARRHNVEGDGRSIAFNSPWDVLKKDEQLFIAMAGAHQLWRLNLNTLGANIHAGTSRENIQDGLLKEAALAQPSGLTTDGTKLYFADSEVSAVRMADIASTGRVDTLIGTGLFDYGDVDGKYPSARLQHCLGVAWHEGFVYVADTYNHKIKRVDPKTRELVTFAGTGKPGLRDDDRLLAELNEPNGLCFVKNKMLIADSNNHVIRSCDMKSGQLTTVIFKGFSRLGSETNRTGRDQVLIKTVRASPRAPGLRVQLLMPPGTQLNPLANSRLRAEASDKQVAKLREASREITAPTVSIPWELSSGQTILNLDLEVYYCGKANAGLCYYKTTRLIVPVEISDAGSTEPAIEMRLEK